MTQYERGRRKEWDVCKRLRAMGWRAQRSAGSHGLWDVVAVRADRPVRLIQVKYSADGRWSDANSVELSNLALRHSVPCDYEVWVYCKGVAEPTIWAPTWNDGWVTVGERAHAHGNR